MKFSMAEVPHKRSTLRSRNPAHAARGINNKILGGMGVADAAIKSMK